MYISPSAHKIWNTDLMSSAFKDSLIKLHPRHMIRNPVMFVVEVGCIFSSLFWFFELANVGQDTWFLLQINVWLWFTLLFANFAESIAEGRGKAQAENLRRARQDTPAMIKLPDGKITQVLSSQLRKGDYVIVRAGMFIPADGTVIEGAATVDEAAITGESAPVIREAGGDRSAVTGGTRVLSDKIVVKITVDPGQSFLDRMIALVEGADRQKTPNEIALSILLAALTLIFLLAVVTLQFFSIYSGLHIHIAILVSLLVCLIPTTIGGLLSAIGISGMDRLVQRNVLALSGRAVEAAGNVDVLLLDKTGTITMGNRMAQEFIALPGISQNELVQMAYLSSMADETPEGRSIVALAQKLGAISVPAQHKFEFVHFTAETRMSGVNTLQHQVRKGAFDSIKEWLKTHNVTLPDVAQTYIEQIASKGGTPLLVATDAKALGLIYLKDILKAGISERFMRIHAMGIKTVMITGDNKLTAKTIALEAGVGDFLAEATPEDKLRLIRDFQAQGRLVAMTGDGTNDAPALAQANVGLAMNTGTQAAREAGNMIDLDSDPTKIIEIVEIGKQLLMTRGALTTFSIANDLAKYFAILPALFMTIFPGLGVLNIMNLENQNSAILSAVIFNALIIIALIPLALRGVSYRPQSASAILKRNLLLYGLGGVLSPFVGIKLIDSLIVILGLA